MDFIFAPSRSLHWDAAIGQRRTRRRSTACSVNTSPWPAIRRRGTRIELCFFVLHWNESR